VTTAQTTPVPAELPADTIARALRGAADVLDRNGWIKGRLIAQTGGSAQRPPVPPRERACCAFAAILIATGHDPDTGEDSNDPVVVRAASALVTWLENTGDLAPADPAAAHVSECEHGEADTTCALCGIFAWNDAQTGPAPVTAALRAAAAFLTWTVGHSRRSS
jgi:hypothetical protein